MQDCQCRSPQCDGCRCSLCRCGGRDRGTPAKRRQQQAGDEPPAMTHSLFLAQECAMKADVVGDASCGLYKMFPAGRFMVLAHDLRFTYGEKKVIVN